MRPISIVSARFHVCVIMQRLISRTWIRLAALLILGGVWGAQGFAAEAGNPAGTQPAKAVASANKVVLLGVDLYRWPQGAVEFFSHEVGPNSSWRYCEVWQTDVCKTDQGELVRVSPFAYPHDKYKGGKGPALETTTTIEGSPLLPDGWQKAAFDDSNWVRRFGPFVNYEYWHGTSPIFSYRSLAMICARGRFEVVDPAKVEGLDVQVYYQGGTVVYLNGTEVARANLPTGSLTVESLADEYPMETYVYAAGDLLNANSTLMLPRGSISPAGELTGTPAQTEPIRRKGLRNRMVTVKVPASLLKKGVNVLSVEVHRAPANETMFTNPKQHNGEGNNNWFGPMVHWWNRCALMDVQLTATGPADNFVTSTARPKGFQVWNQATLHRIGQGSWGDPNEPLRPLEMKGMKNGVYSDQFVVSRDVAIKGLKVTTGDLNGSGGTKIAASNLAIGYATWNWDGRSVVFYDALEPVPPAELPVITAKIPSHMQGAVQPVWVTVTVPKTAPAGTYEGIITVSADGLPPLNVPVKLQVIGNYVLPDAKDFKFYMGVLESPDSLAMQYNVPLWSEEHWKLIDKAFELLALIGTKEVHIPAITHTQLGNEQGMVRFIKQADGKSKLDYSIAERYLETALKHLKHVEAVVVAIQDNTLENAYPGRVREEVKVTQWDPVAKTAEEMATPAWATPEALSFWKPVIEGFNAMLAKRNLGGKMLFGSSSNGVCNPKEINDLRTLAPDVGWVNVTHIGDQNWLAGVRGDPSQGQKVGQLSCVRTGVLWVHWDPEKGKPIYGWTSKDPMVNLCSSRGKNSPDLTTGAEAGMYRLLAEGCLLSQGWAGLQRGVGHVGGDFWPVLKSPDGKWAATLNERWTNWSTLTMSQVILCLIGAGKDGPVPTERLRLLQESLQESELRIVVQEALLDATKKAKLGPDLAKRAEQLCNNRTRQLRYFSLFFGANGNDLGRIMNQAQWQDETVKLCLIADEVTKSLAK